MAFLPSTIPKYYNNHVTKNHPFMTCIVRVNTQSQYWQRTVAKVLNKCYGVHSFRIDDNGIVEISVSVDPSLLLKILGKVGRSAELSWFQFRQCSSNLFMQPNHGGSSYSRDGRYLHAANPSRPKLPSQQALNNQIDGYYYHDIQCYSYGNEQDYHQGYPQSYHEQSYDHQYGYQSGNSHARNQIQT